MTVSPTARFNDTETEIRELMVRLQHPSTTHFGLARLHRAASL